MRIARLAKDRVHNSLGRVSGYIRWQRQQETFLQEAYWELLEISKNCLTNFPYKERVGCGYRWSMTKIPCERGGIPPSLFKLRDQIAYVTVIPNQRLKCAIASKLFQIISQAYPETRPCIYGRRMIATQDFPYTIFSISGRFRL